MGNTEATFRFGFGVGYPSPVHQSLLCYITGYFPGAFCFFPPTHFKVFILTANKYKNYSCMFMLISSG